MLDVHTPSQVARERHQKGTQAAAEAGGAQQKGLHTRSLSVLTGFHRLFLLCNIQLCVLACHRVIVSWIHGQANGK